MPKQSDDSMFRKTKSSRQHADFCRPIRLWISNLFLPLLEITRYVSNIRWNIYTDELQTSNFKEKRSLDAEGVYNI